MIYNTVNNRDEIAAAVTGDITSVFAMCSHVRTSAFTGCASLSRVSLPAATTIMNYAFESCTSLSQVSLPAATTIGSSAFYSCTSLSRVDLPAATTIEGNAFRSCTSLSQVYLLGSRMCSLAASTAFWYTPMSQSSYLGTFGSIYVPASLYSSYIAATNWSIYSSRIVSI